MDFFQNIPADIINFLLVVLFSLLIGLEQRRHHIRQEHESAFGTDRTFTLIGILGYMLYIISPGNIFLFAGGGAAIALLLGIFYYKKIGMQQHYGMTSLVTALLTYCIAPIIYTQPPWLALLIVISILILTEIKESLVVFSQKFDHNEFITLAKFLALAGVVLPLLPDTPVSETINISPYRFWLAIVVISGISYASYLVKKFIFPKSGILLTGILGGLYSSTATTVILSRKSKELKGEKMFVPAILAAITMMYLRIFLLALFFSKDIAVAMLPFFVVFTVISALLTVFFTRKNKSSQRVVEVESHRNPLEFKTSFVFAALFIVFAVVTGFVMKYYGGTGVNTLAFIVGVTDIDPFIINLFQGKWEIESSVIALAVVNAITSNNLIKLIYALVLADKSLRKDLVIGFSVLIILGIVMTLLASLKVLNF